MAREVNTFYRVYNRAYIRDGSITYTDEAVVLACLVHSKGNSRKGEDMTDVRKIMKDINLEKEKK